MSDDRQYAPATLRNRDFILDVLRDVLPTTGVILEIASGSGEHVVHFARCFPRLVFQPSDPDPDARFSIAAWAKAERRRERTRAHCPRRVGTSLANRIGQRDYLHQHGPHFALGGDVRTDARGRRDTLSRSAALSLRSLPTRRDRYRSEQPGVRPESTRSQSDLGSARPRSGCRLGPVRSISAPVITEMPANNLSVVFRRI